MARNTIGHYRRIIYVGIPRTRISHCADYSPSIVNTERYCNETELLYYYCTLMLSLLL